MTLPRLLTAIDGSEHIALAHDTSDEPRDEKGQWTTFVAGKYHPSGTKVKFHSGEHKDRVATLESVIPMRYRKEETTYRAQVEGFPKPGGWDGRIIVTEKHLAQHAHYHTK